jgi:hypothetical protein
LPESFQIIGLYAKVFFQINVRGNLLREAMFIVMSPAMISKRDNPMRGG